MTERTCSYYVCLCIVQKVERRVGEWVGHMHAYVWGKTLVF